MKVREVGNFIREQRGAARLSLRKLSSMAGVSNPYLSQIERGLRHPSAEILQAIAKALRISAETLYVKAGILDERDDVDTVATILKDPSITEKQKRILVDVYQSFKEEPPATPARPKPKKKAKAAAKPSSNGTRGTQARKRATRSAAAKPKEANAAM